MLKSALLDSVPEITHGFSISKETAPSVVSCHQVHRAAWLWLPEGITAPTQRISADALATTQKLTIGVYSADCVPVLLLARSQQSAAVAVAAIHAGWRGTAQKITERVTNGLLQILAAQDTSQWQVLAAIGPCISGSAFEVGPEVPAGFRQEEHKGIVQFLRQDAGRDKYLVDLVQANQVQLESACAGRAKLQVDALKRCTLTEAELPSYRRQGKAAGRILSFIALR